MNVDETTQLETKSMVTSGQGHREFVACWDP